MNSIVLATEDVLSEQAGLCIATEAGLLVVKQVRRNGSGYLKSRIPNFCQMASFQPVVVIADLDQVQCPSQLLADWLGQCERPDDLVIRVAVREVESWLLADHQAMRDRIVVRPRKMQRSGG